MDKKKYEFQGIGHFIAEYERKVTDATQWLLSEKKLLVAEGTRQGDVWVISFDLGDVKVGPLKIKPRDSSASLDPRDIAVQVDGWLLDQLQNVPVHMQGGLRLRESTSSRLRAECQMRTSMVFSPANR